MQLIYTDNDMSLLNEACQKARNTLEYTLLLPEIHPVEITSAGLVASALLQCFKSCYFRLNPIGDYDFFGPSLAPSRPINLYSLNSVSDTIENPSDFIGTDFFSRTILMQCVMSSYDAIMQALLLENLSPYTVANHLKGAGHNQIRNQKDSCLSEKFLHQNSKNTRNENPSMIASGFSDKINNHKPVLKELKPNDQLYKSLFPEDNNHISLFQSDLVYRLMHINKSTYQKSLHLFSNALSQETNTMNDKTSRTLFIKLYNALLEDLPLLHADRLHYLYRMEHIFPLGLADCISQNLYHHRISKKPCPDGENELKRLAIINDLPNVFSRYSYLQFAFDAMSNTPAQKENYFYHFQYPNSMMTRFTKRPFLLHDWFDNFEKFCRLFSKLIFPAFEWYFLLLLFVTVENQNKEKSLRTKLLILQKELASYIEMHHESIENPFMPRDSKENHSLLSFSNYDGPHIIRPIYCKPDSSSDKIALYTEDSAPHLHGISEILKTLELFKNHQNLPLPIFDKTFSDTLIDDKNKYTKYLGQILTFVTGEPTVSDK